MDSISSELHIPRRQLREIKSTCKNRFEAIVPRSWVKTLLQHGRLPGSVPEIKRDLFEWPTRGKPLKNDWLKVIIVVSRLS